LRFSIVSASSVIEELVNQPPGVGGKREPFMVLLLIAPTVYWFGGVPAFRLSLLPALRHAGAARPDHLHGLDIARANAAPLFTEATHAVTCFAVTATLLSAIVKPFGRPFKITGKGGDRSTPRAHWKLAAIFGLIAASSAASIIWAFISPYAASEISSLDFFNLLWAGIAMLIAFIAFLVCFELPRPGDMFETDEPVWLSGEGKILSCRLLAISPTSVRFSGAAGDALELAGCRYKIHLEELGWTYISMSRDPATRCWRALSRVPNSISAWWCGSSARPTATSLASPVFAARWPGCYVADLSVCSARRR
jgi:cellulose synthase (UDP-forming)